MSRKPERELLHERPPEQLGLELASQPWPDPDRFPNNFDIHRVGQTLMADLVDSRDPLVITGYGGVEELLGLLHGWHLCRAAGRSPRRIRILVGAEPSLHRVRPSLSRNRPAESEITDFWLDRGVSLLQCHHLLAAVQLLDSGLVIVRASAGTRIHAKLYLGDTAVTLGSSNYTKPGLTVNLEANVRFLEHDEPERYRDTREFAERIWEQGRDFTDDFQQLLEQLLRKVTWQEALARACSDILEGDWASEIGAVDEVELWPSQEQGIAQALWVLDNVGSVLLADATGSGKTKTGAHLLSALQSRNWRVGTNRKRQPVLVCPPAVRQSWREELAAAGESVSVFSQGILGRSGVHREKEVSSALRGTSLLTVDEAHNFLNPSSARARAILSNTADHVILLTATPINRGVRDLLAIVDLLGADNFDDDVLEVVTRLGKSRRRVTPMTVGERNQIRRALQQFVVRRTKSDLNTLIDREPDRYTNVRGDRCRFPRHEPVVFSRSGPDADQAAAQRIADLTLKLRGLVNLRKELKMPFAYRVEGKTEAQFLEVRLAGAKALAAYHVRSRLRSSRAALIEHLIGTSAAREELGIEVPKPDQSGDVLQTLTDIHGSPPKTSLDVQVPDWLTDATEHARAVEEEVGTYQEILSLVRGMSDQRAEANADYLSELMGRHDRIIAFDSHPISLLDLKGRLGHRGVEPLLATGKMPVKRRAAFSRKFGLEASGTGLVGLCSDAFSEGLNLQGASAVIHLDLPTVIRVLEQRIGRVDRMDSPHESIQVHWPKEESPAYALRSDERLFLRLEDVRDLIGSNVPVPEEFSPDSSPAQKAIPVEELIDAVERGEESRVPLADAFARVRNLISGPEALISPEVYDSLRESEARVLSSVSVVRTHSPWVFVAIGASDRATPRWVLVKRPGEPAATVDGVLDSVAATLLETLTPTSEDVPFDEAAARLLSAALEQISEHRETLLPRRKQKALEELDFVARRYLRDAKRQGDRRRTEVLEAIREHLSAKPGSVDLNGLAEWWLSLLRPEWYSHLTSSHVRRPTRLRDLRSRLKREPVETDRLLTFFENDFGVVPLERRIVAAIVGVGPRDSLA